MAEPALLASDRSGFRQQIAPHRVASISPIPFKSGAQQELHIFLRQKRKRFHPSCESGEDSRRYARRVSGEVSGRSSKSPEHADTHLRARARLTASILS